MLLPPVSRTIEPAREGALCTDHPQVVAAGCKKAAKRHKRHARRASAKRIVLSALKRAF